jgi:hypothetical protein
VFGDGPLTFREFATREPLPLARIHDAVLEFLRDRDDAVLFGAQAVNAYVDEPRMTQDVDIMSPRAVELAEELKSLLNAQFHIAIRVRNIREGLGYRVYQVRKPKNRAFGGYSARGEVPTDEPNQQGAGSDSARVDGQQSHKHGGPSEDRKRAHRYG